MIMDEQLTEAKKTCKVCGVEKGVGEFRLKRSRKSEYRDGICYNPCYKEYNRKLQQKHKSVVNTVDKQLTSD